jgi:hypothetical protein
MAALFNKIAEFDACISGNMARLGSFREEFLQLLLGNSGATESVSFSS